MSRTNRGQTLQDYLLGISLVLLTITAVFAFFPEVYTPFEEPVREEDREMADRLASEVVDVNATARSERTVNLTGLNRTLRDPDAYSSLVNGSGIPSWKQVNVTVQDANGGVLVSGETTEVGSVFREDRAAGTRVRAIRSANRSSDCGDGCQVVVRVWSGG